jgi:hypothetical protein
MVWLCSAVGAVSLTVTKKGASLLNRARRLTIYVSRQSGLLAPITDLVVGADLNEAVIVIDLAGPPPVHGPYQVHVNIRADRVTMPAVIGCGQWMP